MSESRFMISAMDPQGTMWFVRAGNMLTADHMAELFRTNGYTRIAINNLAPEDTADSPSDVG